MRKPCTCMILLVNPVTNINLVVKVTSYIFKNLPKIIFLIRGRRNVFTTGQAKLDAKDYAIKCTGVR